MTLNKWFGYHGYFSLNWWINDLAALLLLLTLSLFYVTSHLLKLICHLLGNQQTLLLCIKKCKNRSLQLQTNQPSFNHQQGIGIHHCFWHQILPLLHWLDFQPSVWIQTRSLYTRHAASALPTMAGGPKCQTWYQSHLPWHVVSFRCGLGSLTAPQILFLWYPRQSPLMACRLPLLSR